VRFEIVELQQRGLADEADARRRSALRQFDRDHVSTVNAHVGIGDAKLLQPLAHDRGGTVEVLRADVMAARRHGLQPDDKRLPLLSVSASRCREQDESCDD